MKNVVFMLFLLTSVLVYALFNWQTQTEPMQPPERTQSEIYRKLSGIDGYPLDYRTTDGSPLILGIRNNLVADTWAALRKNFSWVRHDGRIYLPVPGSGGILSVPENMAPRDATLNGIRVVEVLHDPQNFSRDPTVVSTTILDESSGDVLATRGRRIDTGFSGGIDSHFFLAEVLGAPAHDRVEYSLVPMIITKVIPDDQSIPVGLPSEDYVAEVDGCDESVAPMPFPPPVGSSTNPTYKSRGIETKDWQYLFKVAIVAKVFCRGDNIFVDINNADWSSVGVQWLRTDGTFVGLVRIRLPVGYHRRNSFWIADIQLEDNKLTIDRRSAVHASLRAQRKQTVISAFIELDLTNADYSRPILNEKEFIAN